MNKIKVTRDVLEVVRDGVLTKPQLWLKGGSVGGVGGERHCLTASMKIAIEPWSNRDPDLMTTHINAHDLMKFLPEKFQPQDPHSLERFNDPYVEDDGLEYIQKFNDHKDTTFKDVRAFIDRCIEGLS